MIDLNDIEKYRENNRIEAKKALGGLPLSIWETYSAFANTYGGLILLGVEEYRDKSLHPIDLPDPEGLVREFREKLNDPKKASVNILSANDVVIENTDGNHIIIIKVPRAQRTDMPVYVDGNPLNVYRRNGEGDYKCTREEVESMTRDASRISRDMRILENVSLDALNRLSIRAYRRRMPETGSGETETLPDHELLVKVGAAGTGNDGLIHPTAAGLLMFGKAADVRKEFPFFELEYREEDENCAVTDLLTSMDRNRCGNLIDFYFRICTRIRLDLRPGREDPAVKKAVCEAFVNALVNADHELPGGVRIINQTHSVLISNPGRFRIGPVRVMSGGLSDPRNAVISKMFHAIDIGERSGRGIANIFRIWRDRGWTEPVISQSLNPDRTSVCLVFSGNEALSLQDKNPKRTEKTLKTVKQQLVIVYLTDHISADLQELAAFLCMTPENTRDLLDELTEGKIIVPDGTGDQLRYRLKA